MKKKALERKRSLGTSILPEQAPKSRRIDVGERGEQVLWGGLKGARTTKRTVR